MNHSDINLNQNCKIDRRRKVKLIKTERQKCVVQQLSIFITLIKKQNKKNVEICFLRSFSRNSRAERGIFHFKIHLSFFFSLVNFFMLPFYIAQCFSNVRHIFLIR